MPRRTSYWGLGHHFLDAQRGGGGVGGGTPCSVTASHCCRLEAMSTSPTALAVRPRGGGDWRLQEGWAGGVTARQMSPVGTSLNASRPLVSSQLLPKWMYIRVSSESPNCVRITLRPYMPLEPRYPQLGPSCTRRLCVARLPGKISGGLSLDLPAPQYRGGVHTWRRCW